MRLPGLLEGVTPESMHRRGAELGLVERYRANLLVTIEEDP